MGFLELAKERFACCDYADKKQKAFGVNPFYCFKCNTRMKVKKISYFNIHADSICCKEYD